MSFGVTKIFVLGLLLESELLPLSELVEDKLLLELLLEPLEAGAGVPFGAGVPLGAGFFFLAPAEELLDRTDST